MKPVSTFQGPDGKTWKLYHLPPKQHREKFTHPETGEMCLGITWFGGRYKGKIFIRSTMTDEQKFAITVHEILHVVMRDLGLNDVIEEAIVDQAANRLAVILEQL